MKEGTGFWKLQGPPPGRVVRALLLGSPGRFFDAILEASGLVEYYDEEVGFEPCRLGVRTETVPAASLRRRLSGAAGAFPLLVGYRPFAFPLPVAEEAPRVWFAPSAAGAAGGGADGLLVGLRRGAAPEAGGASAVRVITAREAVSGCGGTALPAPPGSIVMIDPLVMDPSLLPVPTNLEPGGLPWHRFTAMLRELFSRRLVRGAMLLPCPLPRSSPVPPFVLARLVSKILAYALEGRGRKGER